MSETANPVVPPVVENNSSDSKPEQVKPATNDVANETTTEVNNDLAVPKDAITPSTGRQARRKRASDIADSSLVIATPSGGDGTRRQTRSQTRGTPAPAAAPTPAKKPALEKASNGSAAKGRRGRPPKTSGDEKTDSALEEIKEEAKVEPKPKPEAKSEAKPKEDKAEKPEETVDGVSSTTGDKAPAEVKTEKVKPEKEEAKTVPAEKPAVEPENSQETEPPKEKVIEKPLTESTDKAVEGEKKVVNNANEDTVNNHEQQA